MEQFSCFGYCILVYDQAEIEEVTEVNFIYLFISLKVYFLYLFISLTYCNFTHSVIYAAVK